MTTLKTKDFWAVKSRKRGFPDESLVSERLLHHRREPGLARLSLMPVHDSSVPVNRKRDWDWAREPEALIDGILVVHHAGHHSVWKRAVPHQQYPAAMHGDQRSGRWCRGDGRVRCSRVRERVQSRSRHCGSGALLYGGRQRIHGRKVPAVR